MGRARAARAGRRGAVRAAVAQAGAVHLARRGEPRSSTSWARTYEHDPRAYAAASPAERLPLGVPTLLVHGEATRSCPRR